MFCWSTLDELNHKSMRSFLLVAAAAACGAVAPAIAQAIPGAVIRQLADQTPYAWMLPTAATSGCRCHQQE